MEPNGSAKSLVNLRDGEISREIFVNAELYEQEKARIFARAWLYVGHESQIKKPGDFFVSRMGEESVILTRDREAKIHVFLNTCRHRGMRVCRYDEGHTNALYCPYHGWSYGLDGKLIVVQQYEESYSPPFDRENWGLIEARSANLQGTIWATWAARAPSFEDYLGDARGRAGGFIPPGLGRQRPWRRTAWLAAEMDRAVELEHSLRKISPATCCTPSGPPVPSKWSVSGPARRATAPRSRPARRRAHGVPSRAATGISYGIYPEMLPRADYAASPVTSGIFSQESAAALRTGSAIGRA